MTLENSDDIKDIHETTDGFNFNKNRELLYDS